MSAAKFSFRCLVLALVSTAWMSLANTALAQDPHGTPENKEGRRGLFIWLTDRGENQTWHLYARAVAEKGRMFTGRIRVIGKARISGATGVQDLERGDYFKIDGVNNSVSFKLGARSEGDRINLILKGHAKAVEFDIKLEGAPPDDTRWIHVGGGKGESPKSCRFTLRGR